MMNRNINNQIRIVTLEHLQGEEHFIGILRLSPQEPSYTFEGRGFLLGVDPITPNRNSRLIVTSTQSGEASTSEVITSEVVTSSSEIRTSGVVTSSSENINVVPRGPSRVSHSGSTDMDSLSDIATTSTNISSENLESVS